MTQEIHLGEDGFVVFDPRTTQTMLYVSRYAHPARVDGAIVVFSSAPLTVVCHINGLPLLFSPFSPFLPPFLFLFPLLPFSHSQILSLGSLYLLVFLSSLLVHSSCLHWQCSAHMAHFGIASAPDPPREPNRQALVLVASSPEHEGQWLAHVIAAAPDMLEHIKRQGARLLKDFQSLENVSLPASCLPPLSLPLLARAHTLALSIYIFAHTPTRTRHV